MPSKTITTPPTAETTLADLLRMGATVTFASLRSLTGSPQTGYIQVSNEFGSLGLWDIDSATGVEDAVADLTRDAGESSLTLHGEPVDAAEG